MTYTPKPGDRVTSPLLVGEWTVDEPEAGTVRGWWLTNGKDRIREVAWRLTPVAPPLPPEPGVGEVVWARGRYWVRDNSPTHAWSTFGTRASFVDWSEIAADAEPVVSMSRALEWMQRYLDRPAAAGSPGPNAPHS